MLKIRLKIRNLNLVSRLNSSHSFHTVSSLYKRGVPNTSFYTNSGVILALCVLVLEELGIGRALIRSLRNQVRVAETTVGPKEKGINLGV
jgi:hypothetical protein